MIITHSVVKKAENIKNDRRYLVNFMGNVTYFFFRAYRRNVQLFDTCRS